MTLPTTLISDLIKNTTERVENIMSSSVYGTVVEYNGQAYVRLDGSDLLTPVVKTADIKNGERVTVEINNHKATVTGNLTAPSARQKDIEYIGSKISDFEIVLADKVDTAELYAESARIDTLVAESLKVTEWMSAKGADIENLKAKDIEISGTLEAVSADISDLRTDKLSATEADLKYATIDSLKATNATIEKLQTDKLSVTDADIKYATIDGLKATNATVEKLQTDKLSVTDADIKYATIDNLKSTNAEISDLKANKMSATEADLKYATIGSLNAANAIIEKLQTDKLSVTDADVRYANIDFSNIGKAAMEYFYANSGLIENVTIGDGVITGNLVGVTIKGNLIEGGTVVADKLVIKGTDGLYYKLNTDGVKTETEQTEYNSINGSVILAKSITATKIKVDDLVAFDATIGGFKITENSIYSGVKESVSNATSGVYLDKDGQIAIGDAENYVIFYKTESGEYKLRIAAEDITFGPSKKSIEEELEILKDEVSTILRIESSRGTVFKNDSVSTVLSVVIYRGSERITDMAALKNSMGQSAYLQWKWQKFNEDTYGIISADDDRIGNDGFTFTLSPDDVNTKVTFMCELIN